MTTRTHLTPFLEGWTFRRGAADAEQVALPHDAMLGEPRSADAATGNHGAYFPGGTYSYETTWTAPADAADRAYALLFEGVYGVTTVTVDGVEVAACASGYREFRASLTRVAPGVAARIRVEVDNSLAPNSRWYTGAGIYRPVWLESLPRGTRIADDGVRLVTRALAADADVEVTVLVADAGGADAVARIALAGATELVVAEAPVIDGTATVFLTVPAVRGWSDLDPFLYDLTVDLVVGGVVVDSRAERVGLRTLDLSPVHGLRVNGRPVLLRGACVHHDNGILGAATFATAEYRRARILKEAGYNAIRSSHNPLSRAFLDACDELGLYVMDELTDVWFQHKTPHDLAEEFAEVWPEDARAMVAKNRNRPSVILHSIGNEIAESGSAAGVAAAQELSDALRALDPTRPTTIAVNLLLNLMASKGKSAFDNAHYTGDDDPKAAAARAKKEKQATSTLANAVTARIGKMMNLISQLPAADKASRGAFATVDVAGYNYAYSRYRGDRKRYPERVIVGSESFPGDLPAIWREVERTPGIIGDFMWTGWDYLGEAGIGVWAYGDQPGGINKPYPALLAGPGAFDITGQPGAPVFLAQAVWGLLDAPAIAVRPMDVTGLRVGRTPWRTTDALPSWAWSGLRGTAEIEVYSADDQVELVLNGRSLGRKRAGARAGYVARFRAPYEPGELVAVGYRDGRETGRSSLRSADAVSVVLRPEPHAGGPADLTFVWVELADARGTVDFAASDTVIVTVEGPAELLALGTADPAGEDSFLDAEHTTYRGRALAVVRRTGDGPVTVTAASRAHGTASTTLVPAADTALTR